MRTIELDYETYSELDLKVVGLDRYSAHPSFRVLMMAYAIDGGRFKLWEAHKAPFPEEVKQRLLDPDTSKWAFNAQFERVVSKRGLKIPTLVKGWRCTQVLASLMSFSGTLAEAGARADLPLEKQKLSRGKALIRMFCQPHKVTKANPYRIWDWETHPIEWVEFCEYCVQDGVSERALRLRLIKFPVPAIEWELYELDQIINDRGKPIDRQFVANAIAMSARRKTELTSELRDITGLANPGSPAQLLRWLKERGYPFSDLRKDTVKKVMLANKARGEIAVQDGSCDSLANPEEHGFLDYDAVRALKVREWQARLSIKKYDAILLRASKDDRVRYMLQMAGAGRTARWAGRGPQPQNLSSTPSFLEEGDHGSYLAGVTNIIRSGDYESLSLFTREPMDTLVGAVRSSFHAIVDQEFVCADLSSIESAVLAWLSGCERLLGIFRRGLDPYKDFATDFYQLPYDEITRAMRKVCKPPSLGCGYRLGGGELRDGKRTGLWGYAENMGVDMSREDAHRAVKVFRSVYPEIEKFWKALEKAIERTMKTGLNTRVGHLEFEHRKPFLMMWLPSGRPIYYFQPRLRIETVHTGRMTTKVAPRNLAPSDCYFQFGVWPGEEYETEDTYERLAFSYMGQDQKTRQWVRISSHGGRTTEQATQATAREVLAHGGMLRAHRDGYYICSHVHDELVAMQKTGDNYHTLDRLIGHMKAPLDWAPGLPLGASGWRGSFYRKD